jgi:hypothetical protein
MRKPGFPAGLIAGDLLAIAVVTVTGFATHGESGAAVLPRMLTTFLPLSLAWLLAAPFFGLFSPETTGSLRQVLRPSVAMLFAGPLAALLRAAVLNTTVIPVFALVLSVTAALALTVWRLLWIWLRLIPK